MPPVFTSEPQAYLNARQRFDDICHEIMGLTLQYLRRNSFRIMDERGQYGPTRIASREVLHLCGLQEDTLGEAWLNERFFPTIGDLSQQMTQFRNLVECRLEATYEHNHGDVLSLEMIQAHFQLDDIETRLLACIAAAQLSHDITRLYQFATGIDSTLFPAWFYAELVSDETHDAISILRRLEPERPLRVFSLIECGQQTDWNDQTPVLQAPVSVPDRIAAFLVGDTSLPDIRCARIWHDRQDALPSLALNETFRKAVLRQLRRSKPRLALYGCRGSGRRSLLREHASGAHQSVLEIDFSQLLPDETPNTLATLVGQWFREARLRHAMLLLRCDVMPTGETQAHLRKLAPRICQLVEKHPGVICLTASGLSSMLSELFGHFTEITCPAPTRAQQDDLWRKALTPHIEHVDKLEEVVQYVSTSYCLSPGEIASTIQASLVRRHTRKDALSGEALCETLRATRGRDLEGLADLRPTPLGLKDIVLSADALNTLHEILHFARYAEVVREDWGFARMSAASGLSVLFSGPPGTGKTLTAGVLAHELKRALYVVDLSRIVDKYIGETEKRLAKIFDYAQQSQAILLFDEADALFAKRTSVKSSNDRYANLEVNYLLQRLEAYRGMTILTTNLATSLDEALARRIQFKLTFPMPNAEERAHLWQCLLPRRAPLNTIDFRRLGEGFAMSGGHIKNAVFRACIQAASSQKNITTDMLWDAGVHEMREMGHVIRDL